MTIIIDDVTLEQLKAQLQKVLGQQARLGQPLTYDQLVACCEVACRELFLPRD